MSAAWLQATLLSPPDRRLRGSGWPVATSVISPGHGASGQEPQMKRPRRIHKPGGRDGSICPHFEPLTSFRACRLPRRKPPHAQTWPRRRTRPLPGRLCSIPLLGVLSRADPRVFCRPAAPSRRRAGGGGTFHVVDFCPPSGNRLTASRCRSGVHLLQSLRPMTRRYGERRNAKEDCHEQAGEAQADLSPPQTRGDVAGGVTGRAAQAVRTGAGLPPEEHRGRTDLLGTPRDQPQDPADLSRGDPRRAAG